MAESRGFGSFLLVLSFFFTIFLAFKKGEGVSAVLLAIFLRKKGSDLPFFIILFTDCYCTVVGLLVMLLVN